MTEYPLPSHYHVDKDGNVTDRWGVPATFEKEDKMNDTTFYMKGALYEVTDVGIEDRCHGFHPGELVEYVEEDEEGLYWFRRISDNLEQNLFPAQVMLRRTAPVETDTINPPYPPVETDAINPPHYQFTGGAQTIDITEHLSFCLGNVVKYASRAGRKGDPLEDLNKAKWYLDREIERLTE